MRKWKLVPVEPTPEMYQAGQGYIDCGGQKSDVVYRAMLSAAPDPLEDAELRERVALALAEADHGGNDYRDLARAAIAAMKGE